MKVYLDENLMLSSVETEELTQDSVGYNILKLYVPNSVVNACNSFTAYYGAILPNSRKVGYFGMTSYVLDVSDADYAANYTYFKATLEQVITSVPGKVYLGFQFLMGISGNATLTKKNSAVVMFNVRKSVAINNDILVIDPDDNSTDVLESYKNLLQTALNTYVTQANQALSVTTNSLTVNNSVSLPSRCISMDELDATLFNNLFEYADTTDITSQFTLSSYYLDKGANGQANPDVNSKCTDYIDTSLYGSLLISGFAQYATTLICAYDSDKNWLRNYGEGTSAGVQYTDYEYIPLADEAYIRVCTYQYTTYPLTIKSVNQITPISKSKQWNILYGKKYVACGDSFTKGDVIASTKVYPYLIAKRNNMTLVNMAANGSYAHYGADGFTNPNNSYYYQNIPTDADFITIAYGLNETGTTLGDKTSSDNTTIWGAYNEVLSWIIANIPNAKVGIISNDAWMTYEFRNTLQEIATYWGVEFLDLKEYGKPMMITGKYSEDGDINSSVKNTRTNQYVVGGGNGHPNEDGHKVRSYIVENFLRGNTNGSISYTRKETDTLLGAKQDTMSAGTGIDITSNVVSINSTYQTKISTLETSLSTANAKIEALEQETANLKQANLGNTMQEVTTSGLAYTYTIPSATLQYGYLNKVGGMSYKSENLINLTDVAETTISDITYSITDGVITLNGTASADFLANISLGMELSGTYTLALFNTVESGGNVRLFHTNSGGNVIVSSAVVLTTGSNSRTFTATYSGVGIGIYIPNGTTLTNCVIKPMLVSGSTAPTTYKPYFSGIRHTAVTSVTNKGANLINLTEVTEKTMNGITYKYYNGGILVNGRTEATTYLSTQDTICSVESGTTYYLKTFTSGTGSNQSSVLVANKGAWSTEPTFYNAQNASKTMTVSGQLYWMATLASGVTFKNFYIKPILIKGSTTPTSYLPYRSDIVTSIPASVQALDGYGYGLSSSLTNYIDTDTPKIVNGVTTNKTFTKMVAREKIKNLTWTLYDGCFFATIADKKVGKENALCASYTTVNKTYTNLTDGEMTGTSTTTQITIKDSNYADADAFVAGEGENYIYYEMATPEITDISSYLDDDFNLLTDLEGNGTLVFDNPYGQEAFYEIFTYEKL